MTISGLMVDMITFGQCKRLQGKGYVSSRSYFQLSAQPNGCECLGHQKHVCLARSGRTASLALLVLIPTVLAGPVENQLQSEIDAVKKQIAQTQSQIDKVKSDRENDKHAYLGYTKQFGSYYVKLKSELDSINSDSRQVKRDLAVLNRQIDSLGSREDELNHLSVALREALLDAGQRMLALLASSSPGSVAGQRIPLEFLMSEIRGLTIDNNEAIERLWQIYQSIDDLTERVEVFTGASPVDFIPGQADFLQIGLAYLGCVNEQGTLGAQWVPVSPDSGTWVALPRQADAQALHQAIKVRQGNAVPQIVHVPFDQPIWSPRDDKGGNL